MSLWSECSTRVTKDLQRHDAIIIGAGFGGIYAVHRLRGQGLNVLCIEAAVDVGGVWYHNCYPGARCDLLSIDYSYSFSPELQQEWQWSHRYAPQAEILAYLRHVTERFDLRRNMLFNTRITAMSRDDESGVWILKSDTQETFVARHVILATGPLSIPKDPDFPGYATFAGEKYQASRWPHRPVSFAGKRVAVIGTGSSGVQIITEVSKHARHLTVFQRTAAFTAPARNRPIGSAERAAQLAEYPEYRRRMKSGFVGGYMYASGKFGTECSAAEQRAILDAFWEEGGLGYVSAFNDVLFDEETNAIVADYMRERMGEQVRDPTIRAKLMPVGFPVGARRPCCDSGYLEVFNRDNATLVDLRETPIVKFEATGIETTAGHHDLDMVIVALGFDALTGAPMAINPINGKGEALSNAWREGPSTYLGLMTAGFPNMFFINGPGATSLFGNVPVVAEHDADWIGDCIAWLDRSGKTSIDASLDAQAEWTAEVHAVGNNTLLGKASSWYTGGNIPGKKRGILAYMGGFNTYADRCREIAQNEYRGFVTKSTAVRSLSKAR